VIRVKRALKELLVQLVPRELLVQLVHRALRVTKDRRVSLGLKVLRARRDKKV